MSAKRGGSSSKKSFFSGQDAREIAKEFNASLGVCYDEGFSDEKSLRVCCAIDVITELLVIPELPEAVLKKSGIDLSIQVETLYRKVKGIADPEANEKLKQSITRFFRACASLPDSLKLEVTLKKLQDHISGQEITENSLLDTVTVALKRLNNQQAIENSLRALKIFLSFQEHKRKSGDSSIPQYLNRSMLSTDAVLKQWEDLIYASFISIKNLQNNNAAYLKLLDILIFVAALGDSLRLEIVKSGGIRVLMQKMKEDKNITCESARKSLTLLRDLCYKDSSTSSLMGHHEVENHMLIVLQKFRGEREIENLVSQILEQAIYGFDLDLENFEENMKQTKVKLSAYIAEQLMEEDLEKAQYNVGIVHFYSLMQVFTRRLLQLQIHDTLLEIIKKEISMKVEALKEAKVMEEHERILSDCLIVLKRVIQLPETASNDKKSKENIPNKLVAILMPCLLQILTDKQEMKTAVEQAIECFRVFANNETTKQATVNFAQKANLTDKLTILKETYRDDFKLVKIINTLYFLFAKFTTDSNNNSQKNSFVSTLVKQFSAKTTQNKQEQRRNMEYLNDLAEIPTTAKAIIEQGGISFIKNYLKEENKDSKKSHLADSGKIEEHVYNLAEVNEEEDIDEDEESRQSESFSADEISRKDDIAGNGNGNSKEPSNPVEILRKLIQNHNEDIDKFINADIIQEVLKYLRLQSQNRDTVFATLRVLQSCSEEPKTLVILDQNKALESIFIALNQHPTDSDICGLAGLILGKLNAEQLSQDVKEQYSEMGDSFDPKDEDTIEGIRQANIYLGNLLTALPAEESDEIIQSNKLVVNALDKILRPDLPSNFMASFLLLLIRMCNQGEQTKTLIRNSQIPKKVGDYLIQFSGQNDKVRLIGFCLEGLLCMIGGRSIEDNTLLFLDSKTGLDVNLESSSLFKESLQPLEELFSSPKIIQAILSPFFQTQTYVDWQSNAGFLNLLRQSSQLLGRLLESSKLHMILPSGTEEIVLDIWNSLTSSQRGYTIKAAALVYTGRLVANVAIKSTNFLIKFASDQQLSSFVDIILNIPINQEFTQNRQLQGILLDLLRFLRIFLSGNFDKTRLANVFLPSTLFRLFQRLLKLKQNVIIQSSSSNSQLLENSSPLGEKDIFEEYPLLAVIFVQVCEILGILLGDQILAYDLAENNNLIAEMYLFLGKYLIVGNQTQTQALKHVHPQPLQGIIQGSVLLPQRITESVFKLFNNALNLPKFAVYASRVYAPHNALVLLPCQIQITAYSLIKVMQILKSLIVCYDEAEQLECFGDDAPVIADLKDRNKFSADLELIQKACQLFPEIAIVGMLYNELANAVSLLSVNNHTELQKLKKQVPSDIQEQEIDVIAEKAEEFANSIARKECAEQDVIKEPSETPKKGIVFEDLQKSDDKEEAQPKDSSLSQSSTEVIRILTRISSSLQKASQEIVLKDDSQKYLLRLLEIVKNITVDSQTALKVHNLGITGHLLSFITKADVLKSDGFTAQVAATLADIFKFPKALKRVENEIELIQPMMSFVIFVLAQDSQPSKVLQYPQTTAGILDCLKNLTAVESITVKIMEASGVDSLLALFERCLDSIEIQVRIMEILDRLCSQSKEALSKCAIKCTPYIVQFFEKPHQDLQSEPLRAFALLGGTLCRDRNSQIQLCSQSFHKTLLKGIITYPSDKLLTTNCYYALSGLAYNNKDNCAVLLSENLFSIINQSLNIFAAEHSVFEAICSLLSNITFKNASAKRIIGEIGITDQLGRIFADQTNQSTLNSKTMKQLLRAIGNLSLTIDNAKIIINSGFIQITEQIFAKMNYTEEADVMRYCVDVLGNISSHDQSIAQAITDVMFSQNVVRVVFKQYQCIKEEREVIYVIQRNQGNMEIIASCIDALDGLVQNANISKAIAESEEMLILIKILKSSELSENLIMKCTRVLSNVVSVKENSDSLLKYELPLIIGNLLKNLPKQNDRILIYCFRILNRIAAEKVNETQMVQSGLIEALGEGLRYPQGNPEIILNYISLLKSIAKLPNAVPIIGEKSVSNAILRANEYKTNLDIAGAALGLIQRLIKSKAALINITNSTGIEFIMWMIQSKLNDAAFIGIALECLSCLLLNRSEQHNEIVAVQEQLAGMLKRASDNSLVYKLISDCLGNLRSNNHEESEVSTGTTENPSKASNSHIKQTPLADNHIDNTSKSSSSSQACVEVAASNVNTNNQNPTISPEQLELSEDQKSLLLTGSSVKLFRTDGSSKSAILRLSADRTEIVAYKKGGAIKPKYHITLAEITDISFNFEEKSKLWEASAFAKAGGIFSKKPASSACASISCDATDKQHRKSICVEFPSIELKKQFENAFIRQYNYFKNLQQQLAAGGVDASKVINSKELTQKQ